ncbi:MAG TPA: dienelactone hydrolase family protein [Kofleriaceae bacterium]|nr:dienelactone hydrolase family protein [Kofleriaceae bacterium]
MPSEIIELSTQDGPCRTEILTPDGTGPWPAIIFCFDAGGPRPAMTKMAERIAQWGYVVAIPDFYHRVGSVIDILPPGVPKDASQLIPQFANPDFLKKWMSTYYVSALSYDHLKTDVGALLAHLATRRDVTGGVGSTGYCMGGNISVRIATIFGDQIAATAAFHAGGLVTPAPDSPHLRVQHIKSKVYVAGAEKDMMFNDDAKKTFEAALAEARVDHTVVTYPALHGFAVSDNPTYNAEQSERHFAALEALYKPLATAPRPSA